MDTVIENIAGADAPDRKTLLPMALPVDLHDWATRHAPMISRLSQSFTVTSTPLSENALWNVIAEHFSGDWKEKHAELQRAEKRLAQIMAPENVPLGLVGAALHSNETNDVARHHALALADFTIINETLRQQEELHKLLGVMLDYQHTLAKSHGISQNLAGITQSFGAVASMEPGAVPEAGAAFGKSAAKKPVVEGLSLSFKQIASKLWGRTSEEAKPAKAKQPTASPAL